MLNYQRVVPKQVHTNDPIGQECAMLRVPRVPTCSTRPFGPDVVVKRRGSPRATSGTQQGVFSGGNLDSWRKKWWDIYKWTWIWNDMNLSLRPRKHGFVACLDRVVKKIVGQMATWAVRLDELPWLLDELPLRSDVVVIGFVEQFAGNPLDFEITCG